MNDDIKQLISEVIEHTDKKAVETQEHFDKKITEVKQYVDEKATETKQYVDEKAVETKQHFDERTNEIKQYVDKKTIETQRHFGVVGEALRHDIQLVAEGVTMANQRIDGTQKDVGKLNDKVDILGVKAVVMEGRMDRMEKNMEVIKTDITFIKAELYQKVSRNEFTFLENRVAALESKRA